MTQPNEHYTLYVYRNSYAMIAHALLEEFGATYELRWVEIFTDNPDPEFLTANPNLKVPTLLGPDGPIYESSAIALYLAEKFPQANLTIPLDDPRRGLFHQWLSYLASTLQPEVNIQYHPELYFDDAETQKRLREASMKRLAKILDVIETGIGDGPYFFGETRTVCDYCLALQAIWPPIYPGSIADYPNIERLTDAIITRPAVSRILKLHQD